MIPKNYLTLVFSLFASLAVYADDAKQALPSSVPGGAQFMKQHPASDVNGDGVLTAKEQDNFCVNHTIKALGGGYTYRKEMVAMRDGVKLATGIFVPEGKGPLPVVLIRTAYQINAAAMQNADIYRNKNIVFICQDLRGDGESEGKGGFDARIFDNEIDDGYDTIEWIASQPYCNGSVGMTGNSGHGFSAYMAYLAKPSSLKAVSTKISGGNAELYWTFHNGVRREMYNWLRSRNIPIPQWPKPTITVFDKKKYVDTLKHASVNNETVFIAKTGWYDIFLESSLDYFKAFGKKGKVFVQVDASGHGNMIGKKFPNKTVPSEWRIPDLVDATSGIGIPAKSHIVYYLMGDCSDPNAPGNTYKFTNVWPVPHEKVSYYMNQDGSMGEKRPRAREASLTFQYDPRNPVPSAGGDVFIHKGVGPLDQRVLKDRTDVLRFKSESLTKPLEITGKLKAELFIKTDVEDTTFTAKLIDVYPDGYEAIIKDSIIMTRFNEGIDKESKIEKGNIYKLTMDMWSTAYVFNKGHKMAVHISSSNSPKYEVHPNTFEPVMSFNDVPVANNTVMFSAQYPSRIILPVVK